MRSRQSFFRLRLGSLSVVFLLSLILVLFGLVLYLAFLHKTSQVVDAWSDISQCRQSNELQCAEHVVMSDAYQESQCPTLYVPITSGDHEQIQAQLSNEMARCWYKMMEGSCELFDTRLMQTEYNCVVCSVAEFSSDVKGEQIDHFLTYLSTHNVPAALRFDGTYTEYITGRSSDRAFASELQAQTQDTIRTDVPYASIFVYAKKGQLSKLWLSTGLGSLGLIAGSALLLVPDVTVTKAAAIGLISGSIGAGTGYAMGSEDSSQWDSAVVLYPYTEESLKQLGCEVLPADQVYRER